jgi:two-component system nitrogen regulation response regulator NtrX
MDLLKRLPFSGNIRELRNIIERIVILSNSDIIKVDDVERLGLAFSMTEAPHTHHHVETHEPVPHYEETHHPNVDEEISRSVILTPADLKRIESADHKSYSLMEAQEHPLESALHAGTFQAFKDQAEKVYIEERLREHNWNISRTAEALDIQRSHLYTKMRKYGLTKDKPGEEGVVEPEELS